jgi:hypothetical protein
MASMPNPTMPANPSTSRVVVGGIDTHKDLHVAAVIDTAETVLATHSFSTTHPGRLSSLDQVDAFLRRRHQDRCRGHRRLRCGDLPWIYRHLVDAGIEVLEVDRPDRSGCRRKGKDDDLDAISAARAAMHGRRISTPKARTGRSSRFGCCG